MREPKDTSDFDILTHILEEAVADLNSNPETALPFKVGPTYENLEEYFIKENIIKKIETPTHAEYRDTEKNPISEMLSKIIQYMEDDKIALEKKERQFYY